ncbi:META domain-containing protein [Sphingorhabdus soli]|uniref:META domain-containing protein n=1 Tax=Flavisphingopyxis soli TaxID=2601267 RepID=A0A5C6UAU0_9SPHN|nr:META domain-containing protein [Sphingorhabdus soli]TXC68925.1 META domain-containing protein [Sphingorhabdus soli]
MIRTFAVSALATLALAGCTTVQNGSEAAPAADGDTYLALGTEPGWTLEITPTRLNYVGSYGETRVAEANPGARTTFNGHRYEGQRLTVDITHGACSDGMSDQRYADHVTVELDGATLSGCGGATLPPADLAGTRWQMRSINGASVDRSIATSLAFDGTRMSGSAGCNRFSASYSSDGTRLSAGPIAATKMACTGPAKAQEQAAFAILGAPVTIRFAADGAMILMGTGGHNIVLDRVT